MAYRDYKVYYFPNGGTVGVEMDNVLDVRVTKTLNAKANSFELILDNKNGRAVVDGEVKYKPNETLKVYASEGNVDITNVNHLVGVFTILNHEVQPDIRTIKLICGDKTYTMLSKIFVGDVEDNVNDLVELIVQRVNQEGDTATPITTYIDSTDSSSSAFPSINFVSAYKTAYDCISELSQTNYTGDDRAYMFWFDENDAFHWTYPSQTPDGSLLYGTDPIIDMKISKAEAESVAMIIYDAGLDKNDASIVDFYVDENAGTIKNQIKFQPMTNIADELRRAFQNAGTYSGMSNETFVQYCEDSAKAKAKAIIDKVGTGLWQAVTTVEGATYTPGNLYTVNAADFGFPSTDLRVDRIVHTMNKDGWRTQLTLLEDPVAEVE